MKKTFVSDLCVGQSIDDIFVIRDKQAARKKNGDSYLVGNLVDRTGRIKAVVWDNVAAVDKVFSSADCVRIKGHVAEYGGALQLVIQHAEQCDPRDIKPEYFLPQTDRDVDRMLERLVQINHSITNPHLKKLLTAFFDDQNFVQQFKTAPAAKQMHHAYLGGLLEHTLSVLLMMQMVAAHYTGLDQDLLMAGAILHDIGKIEEFSFAISIDYSDQGRLLSHIVLGVEMVQRKIAALEDFPENLALLLKHMIISHHGTREFGSPEPPKTLEAVVLNYIDDLDAKVNGVRSFIDNGTHSGPWTSYHRVLERFFYRGTENNEVTVE